ncbi:MAG TPA: FUSC family protein [Terriglobales bacterium]|nr:FUSC family protein [Terriglobales bacterium]
MARANKLGPNTLLDAVRTTVAAVLAMLLARLLKLPEFYWAPISAVVIIQSTIDPKTLAWQRFAGTALGAAMGAVIATVFPASPSNTWVYAGAIFLAGVLCVLLRFRGAYRFAAITLSIILLIARTRAAWIVAWHRFVEVSLGIAVALTIALLWPIKTDD